MQLSNKAVEKLYDIRKKLNITYKASVSEASKKRIAAHLKQIETIIRDIENGIPVNLDDYNLFSDELKILKDDISESSDDGRISYAVKIDNLKLTEASKDTELDQIFSFFEYFDKHFVAPLSSSYLKLEYDLSKKRDTYFNHYDNLRKLLKEYIDDINLLKELKNNEQITQFKIRLLSQKKHFLVKLSELLHELKEFFETIINGYRSGMNTIFNPKEKYIYRHKTSEKTEFEGVEMLAIIDESLLFVGDFLNILRIPDFRKI